MTLTIRHLSLGLIVLTSILTRAEGDEKVDALLSKVASADKDVRFEARAAAAALGAPAVRPLVRVLSEGPPGVADERLRREAEITARAALELAVHHAGRPGADSERDLVAAELARALDDGPPTAVKRELLHLVAFLAGDASVSAVAKHLGDADRHVRETARLALERIPGTAAAAALVAGIQSRPEEERADLVFSVGKKGDPSLEPFLSGVAGKGGGNAALAALEALARIGAAGSESAFEASLAKTGAPGRAAVFREYLRLADNLAAAGKGDAAAKIYRKALVEAPLDHQRERALFQLASKAPGDAAAGMEVVITGLADPAERVRALALARIDELQGPEVLSRLTNAYPEAGPELRASLLRAIASKSPEAARPLLEGARDSSHEELKVTALDIEGKLEDPALEPLYLKLAGDGSPGIRPVAMKGYLLLARRQVRHAFEMYGRALETATEDEDRAAALRGLISLGEPEALETLAGLFKDPLLGADAARGSVDLAARLGASGNVDEAEKRLRTILVGDFPREVRNEALAELRALDRDPQRSARSQGFLVDWWLVGPMESRGGSGLEREYFPERVIHLVHEQRIGPRRFRWQPYREISLDGVIDLIPVFRRSDNRIAYAYTEIDEPAPKDVLFKIGSDDGVALWLNGERIHLLDRTRPLKKDEDSVKASLAAGKNRVLLKVSNDSGTWEFACRITDLDGKPLEVPAPN
ncbi:MAG TPA: hypothetical protein VMT52_14395 [Planctomycetota bacterium]|nr:hypothetical protein [Planctomycetota bacterium]